VQVIKDPAATLDYVFDWAPRTNARRWARSDWLEAGETIDTATVTAESGLTVDSSGITDTDTSVTAWLSGGTADTDYEVVCQIVTSEGRTDERTITVKVRNR
jgi:hypothetical protein